MLDIFCHNEMYSFFALFVHVHGDMIKQKLYLMHKSYIPGNCVSNELIHIFVATLQYMSNDVFTMSLKPGGFRGKNLFFLVSQ